MRRLDHGQAREGGGCSWGSHRLWLGARMGWGPAALRARTGLWGRQMLRGLSQPPRPQLHCRSTPREGLQSALFALHTGSRHVALELSTILLPQPSQYSDYWPVPPHGCLSFFNRLVGCSPPTLLYVNGTHPPSLRRASSSESTVCCLQEVSASFPSSTLKPCWLLPEPASGPLH